MPRIRTDRTKEYLLELRQLHDGCFRWIEHVGWLVEQFMGQYTFMSPMSPYPDVLNNCLYFGNDRKRCMFMKDKLNSEIVMRDEDEEMQQIWAETYNRTHKDNRRQSGSRRVPQVFDHNTQTNGKSTPLVKVKNR